MAPDDDDAWFPESDDHDDVEPLRSDDHRPVPFPVPPFPVPPARHRAGGPAAAADPAPSPGGLIEATVALARLDERLAAAPDPVRAGWMARAALAEAAAGARLDGTAIAPATLRLAEAGAATGLPDPALAHALAGLALLRSAAARSPRQIFTPRRLMAVARLRRPGDDRPITVLPPWLPAHLTRRHDLPARLDQAIGPDQLAGWRRQAPLLAAAAIVATWRASGCEDIIGAAIGRALAAAWVRRCGLTRGPWLTPALGFLGHAADWRPDHRTTWPERFVAGAARSADWGLTLQRRLGQARQDLLRACDGRRANSRLPGLVELLIARSTITPAEAAAALDISRRAAAAMIAELAAGTGGVIRELTGRAAFRLYGVL